MGQTQLLIQWDLVGSEKTENIFLNTLSWGVYVQNTLVPGALTLRFLKKIEKSEKLNSEIPLK